MKYEGRLEGHDFAPRPPRVDTNFEVLVRCAAGEFEASITNLSSRGFRLRSPEPLKAGWEVALVVPKMPPVKGVIRWAAGGDAGGAFAEAVAL